MKPTPTPWEVCTDGVSIMAPPTAALFGPAPSFSQRMICLFQSAYLTEEAEARANALLVVRAVNAHAELLAACEAEREWLVNLAADYRAKGMHKVASDLGARSHYFRDIIARAKEKSTDG